MAITRTTAHQHSLLQQTLMEQLNPKDPLIILASRIPWTELCNQFTRFYSEIGRPSKDIRLMIGLLILKQMENLSDERLVVEWTRNPYYQAFCGMIHFQWKFPAIPLTSRASARGSASRDARRFSRHPFSCFTRTPGKKRRLSPGKSS